MLGSARKIETKEKGSLKVSREVISLPRAADYEKRISNIEAEQKKLLTALKPTNINFKAFLPLLLQHRLWPEQPSHHSQSYLHDDAQGRKGITQLDADNRLLVENYLSNIQIMERLTRLNTNLALLKRHLAETQAANKPTLDSRSAGCVSATSNW